VWRWLNEGVLVWEVIRLGLLKGLFGLGLRVVSTDNPRERRIFDM